MGIIGIDEVGRGSWAGPVSVGAVATPDTFPAWWATLRDSKRMSPRARKTVVDHALADGLRYMVVHVEADVIDRIGGVTKATRQGAREAVHRLLLAYPELTGWEIQIDGLDGMGLGTAVLHGDSLVPEISAAAIMAKVARDDIMAAWGLQYPDFRFGANSGYGTGAHVRALEAIGPIPHLHRRSVAPVKAFYDR